jgi:hypothetical protein
MTHGGYVLASPGKVGGGGREASNHYQKSSILHLEKHLVDLAVVLIH